VLKRGRCKQKGRAGKETRVSSGGTIIKKKKLKSQHARGRVKTLKLNTPNTKKKGGNNLPQNQQNISEKKNKGGKLKRHIPDKGWDKLEPKGRFLYWGDQRTS